MKKLFLAVSVASSALTPSIASAQAIPAAIIAVVDLEKVTSDCNACKTANAALRSQVAAFQTRGNTLAAPLQTEGKSIQAAIDALKGKEPDAALQARIKAFQAKQQQGSQELERQKQQLQLNQQYVQKQIADKLAPIYTQVMQRRGANVMLEIGQTLGSTTGLDVTNDVVAALNAALPTLQTTAPVQQQPQGR